MLARTKTLVALALTGILVCSVTLMTMRVYGEKSQTAPPEQAVDLSAEVVAAPATGWKTLTISSQRSVKSDLTIPASVCLKFEDGGMCEVADGATLTINGPLEAPMARIFAGGGKVVFGPGRVEKVYPQWWGAQTDDGVDDAAAIQVAIDSLCYAGKRSSEHVPPNNGVVSFPAGRYEISSTLRFYDGTTLEGGAHNRTELYAAKPVPAILQRPNLSPPAQGQRYNDAARINGVRIARLILNGKSSAVGLDLTNVGYTLVEHVTVRECKIGIRMSQFAMHNTLLNPAIAYCDTGIEIDQTADHTCIFGGRISGGSIGILVKVASGLDVCAMSFEAYKETGLDIREGDSVNLQHPWFASTFPATAIKIGPQVSACTIVNPRFHGSTPKLIDNQAKDTAILGLAKDVREGD